MGSLLLTGQRRRVSLGVGSQPQENRLDIMLTYPLIAPEELSEEDQQLKSELDMLVERLTVGLSWADCLVDEV
jgi:hypothetical protein